MKNQDLIDRVAKKIPVTHSHVRHVIAAAINEIAAAQAAGEPIELTGFGSFDVALTSPTFTGRLIAPTPAPPAESVSPEIPGPAIDNGNISGQVIAWLNGLGSPDELTAVSGIGAVTADRVFSIRPIENWGQVTGILSEKQLISLYAVVVEAALVNGKE